MTLPLAAKHDRYYMTKNIFISYRREDEGPATRFLKSELEILFEEDQVFTRLQFRT
jgi:hypothetical protein